MKLKVEFVRPERRENRGRGEQNSSRERRRSRSPYRGRRHSRSHSWDRRDRGHDRSRDRDPWPVARDNFGRDYPPSSHLDPHAPGGRRPGLLDPPYPLPPGADGPPSRGPPPSFGSDLSPSGMRDSYGSALPPPSRGGYTSGRGESVVVLGTPFETNISGHGWGRNIVSVSTCPVYICFQIVLCSSVG